jgi:transcriptional regulator with XRE-family HTH domain
MSKRAARKNSRSANDFDTEIGARLRIIRLERNLSQEALGTKLGISFQQVQKYERGVNRIASGRLQQIAQILTVPLSDLIGNSKHKTEQIDPTLFKINRELNRMPDHMRAPLLQYIKAIAGKANE